MFEILQLAPSVPVLLLELTAIKLYELLLELTAIKLCELLVSGGEPSTWFPPGGLVELYFFIKHS